MPFPTKVQPADMKGSSVARNDQGKSTGGSKSRLKRLFERQFQSVLRISSSSEKLSSACEGKGSDRDEGGVGDPEPNSVFLVFGFMEDSNEKATAAAGSRSRCNCFNGNFDDRTDDEFSDDYPPINPGYSGDVVEILKNLVPCASITERNLLADASKIMEKSKIGKVKADFRKIAASGLRDLGYDASVCKSRWEKTPCVPAGEYEYVDVIVSGDRYLLDVDFRSEFEIARSTKNYRAVLQLLPAIFVGKESRLQQIVSVVSEASRQSLKKKGLHFPPWRKAEYMRAKWLSPYERTSCPSDDADAPVKKPSASCQISAMNFSGEFQIRQGSGGLDAEGGESNKITVVVSPWQPPAVKPKTAPPPAGSKIVAGLASVLREKSPSPIF